MKTSSPLSSTAPLDRESKSVHRENHASELLLGPDDRSLCAVKKFTSAGLRMNMEVVKTERDETETLQSSLHFQNEIQRIAFQETLNANRGDRGSFSGQRGCGWPVHLQNWRPLKCMLVTVRTVQWKRLFSSHVTHKGDPYRRIGVMILPSNPTDSGLSSAL